MMEKISERNFGWFVLGLSLAALSAGALYSLKFVRLGVGFIAMIVAIMLSTYYINTSFLALKRKEILGSATLFLGFIGGLLLLLFFGIQSPQLPLKKYLLIAGIILTIPGFKDILTK